jgi:hypothetical protein
MFALAFEVVQDFVELNDVMLEIVDFGLIQINHQLKKKRQNFNDIEAECKI